ncbi:MAG: hypothetical protein P4L10_01480 [Acidobacteriaceae bacterium]|nr:hypothetical protein [Acidobacteriaceae bacterium]
MSEDDLNIAENTRNKRLKTLELVACWVGLVVMLGALVAMWNPGAYWSRSSRHVWQDFFWMVYGCSTVGRLIAMQKRTDLKAGPSPIFTLGLTQELAGSIKPLCSDYWSEGSSESR